MKPDNADVWSARQIVQDPSATQHQRNTAFETLVCFTDGAPFTSDMRATLERWRDDHDKARRTAS